MKWTPMLTMRNLKGEMRSLATWMTWMIVTWSSSQKMAALLFEYFDSIEIGLIKGEEKKPFNINGLNRSLICEIDFSQGKALLKSKGNSKRSV